VQVEEWPIQKLREYGKNPKRNNHAIDRMVQSLQSYGFKIPILAVSSGEIIDGHLRYKAAKRIGLRSVPVILCDDWSEAQRKSFRVLATQSNNWASFDIDLLSQEIADLNELGVELEATGFTDAELSALLNGPTEAVEPETPNTNQDKPQTISFPSDAWGTVSHAIHKLREQEQQEDIPDWRCIELLAAEYLS
jgi:ParB-like chromosome segregation protein Spo0J